jgi:predicted lactoylglutathione lyase
VATNRTCKLFVNLPVRDLKRSIEFFTRLGFAFNPKFTDDQATCMILSPEA